MGLIVDTSVFIESERKSRVIDLSRWRDYGQVFLSVMTTSELLVGVHQANTPERRVRRTAFVDAILSAIPSIPIDGEIARIHARLFSELRVRGQTVGAHDLWIAASALANDHAFLTANVREFSRIPELEVLQFSG